MRHGVDSLSTPVEKVEERRRTGAVRRAEAEAGEAGTIAGAEKTK
jgi:hypothetical protein